MLAALVRVAAHLSSNDPLYRGGRQRQGAENSAIMLERSAKRRRRVLRIARLKGRMTCFEQLHHQRNPALQLAGSRGVCGAEVNASLQLRDRGREAAAPIGEDSLPDAPIGKPP